MPWREAKISSCVICRRMGLQGTNGVLCNVHFNYVLQRWHQSDKIIELCELGRWTEEQSTFWLSHTARTIRGYRATCNSTKENTFLLINGFLTPGAQILLTCMIHCCQFVQTSMSLLLVLRQRNFTTDTRCQVVTSFIFTFPQYTPTHFPQHFPIW